ncbi:hypothetical protein TSAR_003318 [Trichomalopsis sarcophagae]|uniref:Uncharacterized protein n=1 Tax=Trichomalopsis sarcophagae TaxID=543379 RepID=A0A232F5Q8_9HYME|nr:hypothetical protein TSAR_003318 [Trichomalopsis sarcophagae]
MQSQDSRGAAHQAGRSTHNSESRGHISLSGACKRNVSASNLISLSIPITYTVSGASLFSIHHIRVCDNIPKLLSGETYTPVWCIADDPAIYVIALLLLKLGD